MGTVTASCWPGLHTHESTCEGQRSGGWGGAILFSFLLSLGFLWNEAVWNEWSRTAHDNENCKPRHPEIYSQLKSWGIHLHRAQQHLQLRVWGCWTQAIYLHMSQANHTQTADQARRKERYLRINCWWDQKGCIKRVRGHHNINRNEDAVKDNVAVWEPFVSGNWQRTAQFCWLYYTTHIL